MPRNFKNPILTCEDCEQETPRTAATQKVCKDCSRERQRQVSRSYRAKNLEQERARSRERYIRDSEKIAAQRRVLFEADPERRRNYERRYQEKHRARIRLIRKCREYGISMDELMDLLTSQDYTCPICMGPIDIEERWAVDHCHDSGRVRGALHHACNVGIGMLGDDPANCRRAADYLRAQ